MRKLSKAVILVLSILALSSCSSEPTPFKTGAETSPPYGCIDYRARGGEC